MVDYPKLKDPKPKKNVKKALKAKWDEYSLSKSFDGEEIKRMTKYLVMMAVEYTQAQMTVPQKSLVRKSHHLVMMR